VRFPQTPFVILILLALGGMSAPTRTGIAQGLNTITFDNRSGRDALVKLIGPSSQAITVPNGDFRTVNVATGQYSILVRYGGSATEYSYVEGGPFTVSETVGEHSAVKITLHPVVGGNYVGRPATAGLFDAVGPGVPPSAPASSNRDLGGTSWYGPVLDNQQTPSGRPASVGNVQIEFLEGGKAQYYIPVRPCVRHPSSPTFHGTWVQSGNLVEGGFAPPTGALSFAGTLQGGKLVLDFHGSGVDKRVELNRMSCAQSANSDNSGAGAATAESGARFRVACKAGSSFAPGVMTVDNQIVRFDADNDGSSSFRISVGKVADVKSGFLPKFQITLKDGARQTCGAQDSAGRWMPSKRVVAAINGALAASH